MEFFVRCIRHGGDSYSSHVGMDQETVLRLLTEIGATGIEFMSKPDWEAAQIGR